MGPSDSTGPRWKSLPVHLQPASSPVNPVLKTPCPHNCLKFQNKATVLDTSFPPTIYHQTLAVLLSKYLWNSSSHRSCCHSPNSGCDYLLPELLQEPPNWFSYLYSCPLLIHSLQQGCSEVCKSEHATCFLAEMFK